MTAPSPAPRHSNYDIVIVGAGIAGCAAARALVQADPKGSRRILLVDLHRDHNRQFAGEFIHPRGVKVLESLALAQDLRSRGAVEMAGFLVHEQPDSSEVRLSYDQLSPNLGPGLGVDHLALNRSLRDQMAQDPRIELCAGWRATGIVQDQHGRVTQIDLRSADRRERRRLDCGTLVAADGKRSTLRKLAKIQDHSEALGFTVGLSFHSDKLTEPKFAQVLLGGPGPMLLYAIEEVGATCFRYRLTIDVPRGLPAKGPELPNYLRFHYFPYLPDAIACACERSLAEGATLDLAPAVDLPAIEARVPGLVLVGDAAGCSHPITASGMTMALLDAENLGRVAALRPAQASPWLNAASLRSFHAAHDRYVPTRQAVASAIAEAFRGEHEGARCIRRALFSYWRAHPRNARRSLALLSCTEARPQVFLSEYVKAAKHALSASLFPQHATELPLADRWWKLQGTLKSAQEKLGLVADVGWKQVKPGWWKDPGRGALGLR